MFHNILWPGEPLPLNEEQPACLVDLALDQVFTAMTEGRSRDVLLRLLWTPLLGRSGLLLEASMVLP